MRMLLITTLLLSAVNALSPSSVLNPPTECTGLTDTPTPFASPFATSFYIDAGSYGKVIFVQASTNEVTVAGDCSLVYDADRQHSLVTAPSGCCEIGVPLLGNLDVFVNGDAREVYLGQVVLGDTSLRTDGFGSLLSNAKLNVTGKLSVDANGKSRIMLLNEDSVFGPTTIKVDGISDVALYGTYEQVTIERINGMSRMYVGTVVGDTEIKLMDGFTQLSIDGSEDMKITGSQLGAANDIKIVEGTCKGPKRCTKVAKDGAFWPRWNDLEFVG